AYSQVKRQPQVQRMSLSPQDPIQLQVQTSIPVVPQAQIISDPERLIIDIPGAVPGSALRALTVNRNDVRRIRVGLFASAPPVTRIVFDLNSPLTYRITSLASGFAVTLLSGKSDRAQIKPASVNQTEANPPEANPSADSDSPTVGWVLQRVASSRNSDRSHAPVVKAIAANAPAPVKG